MKEIPETFEGLAWQLIKLLPSDYKHVDIVADTYQENSIKTMKRKRYLLHQQSQTFHGTFLSNNDNKTKMIELIFETIIKEKSKFLNILGTTEVYLSGYKKCILLIFSTTTDVNDLYSNQEEADTNIVIHALHSLHHSQIPAIKIRSPSGDTEILVLTIVHLYNYKEKIHSDNGTGIRNIQIIETVFGWMCCSSRIKL